MRDLFARNRIPAAFIASDEPEGDAALASMGLVEPVAYPGTPAPAPVIRAPVDLSASAKIPSRRAPQVGEHSDAILAELGYDADAIRSDLVERKIQAVIPGRRRTSLPSMATVT